MLSLGKLLIVDDDEDLVKLLKLTLSRIGYTVQTAANVETGIKMLGEETFDLVISDINMPDGTGLDLLEAIRGSELKVEVLVVSSQRAIATAVEAMRLGARNYLEKPVDLEKLKATVRELMREVQQK